MPRSAGYSLGQLEIVAPFGRGRMGEAYRVTNTRLGRQVLPAAFAADAD